MERHGINFLHFLCLSFFFPTVFYRGAELENKKSQTVGLGLKDYLSHDN